MTWLAKSGASTALLAAAACSWLAICCAPPPEKDPDAAVPPGPHPIGVDPEVGAVDVPIDKVIRVQFSDHLDGTSVKRDRFKLYSGPLNLWVMSYYDPVRGRLSVWPSSSMWKNATWVLEIGAGLYGIDGYQVDNGVVTEFRTGEEGGDNQPFPFLSYETDIKPIFDARCASCHNDDGVAGLSLASAESVAATALGVPSTGWPEWKRITASRPGESYLLYKIIGDERIAGAPMPRSFDDDGQAPPLPVKQQEAIADWIAGGAAFFDQPDAGN